jgi:hypothetical protein
MVRAGMALAFVRDHAMLPELALGRELDRTKGAGEMHDKERDPGHYIDLTDDGKALGIVPLDRLPVMRQAYDMQLMAATSTQCEAREGLARHRVRDRAAWARRAVHRDMIYDAWLVSATTMV